MVFKKCNKMLKFILFKIRKDSSKVLTYRNVSINAIELLRQVDLDSYQSLGCEILLVNLYKKRSKKLNDGISVVLFVIFLIARWLGRVSQIPH